jgi:hypothetical protein
MYATGMACDAYFDKLLVACPCMSHGDMGILLSVTAKLFVYKGKKGLALFALD